MSQGCNLPPGIFLQQQSNQKFGLFKRNTELIDVSLTKFLLLNENHSLSVFSLFMKDKVGKKSLIFMETVSQRLTLINFFLSLL